MRSGIGRTVSRAVGTVVITAAAQRLQRRLAGPVAASPWWRINYRGKPVSLAGGALAAGAVIGAAALDTRTDRRTRDAALLAGGLAAAAGLVDDMFGSGSARGLRGHARAVRRGELTTGALKVAAIGAGGLLAAWRLGDGGIARRVAAGSVVAASANLVNLLDVRPGRALKGALAMSVAGAGAGSRGRRLALVTGATAIGSISGDLREETMLGDSGANCLGAVLGVSLVAGAPRRRVVAMLAAFTVLTVASEMVSFSSVIEKSPTLRWFDRLGRLPEIGSSKSHHA